VWAKVRAMRLVLHVLGWLLVFFGLVVFAGDLWTYLTVDRFTLRPLGEVWAAIDRDSLAVLQPAIERHVAVWLWQDVLFPVLLVPAAPLFAALGAILIFFTRRKAPPGGKRRMFG
jgi:hypothetical protein